MNPFIRDFLEAVLDNRIQATFRRSAMFLVTRDFFFIMSILSPILDWAKEFFHKQYHPTEQTFPV